MIRNANTLGVALMIATTFVFAMQDGISRYLAGQYNVLMIVMIRYWFFAIFAVAMAARQPGGLRRAVHSTRLPLQIFRGVLLAAEVGIIIVSFVRLGLVETHAVFVCYPLIVAALSGPVLGEHVGPRRWAAIGAGFVGVMIVLEPGFGVFDPQALIALTAAVMFALYGLLTRMLARTDRAMTTFFWTGVAGAAAMTVPGLAAWEPMSNPDRAWMALLCLTGAGGHFLLIKTYEVAEASAVQPFAYFQFVFAAALGISVFGEALHPNAAIGGAVIVAAGLFTFWRERRNRAA